VEKKKIKIKKRGTLRKLGGTAHAKKEKKIHRQVKKENPVKCTMRTQGVDTCILGARGWGGGVKRGGKKGLKPGAICKGSGGRKGADGKGRS